MEKTFNKLYVIILSAVVLIASVSFFLLPDKEFSENENRNLETLPEASVNGIVSGEYTELLGSYFADQFPFRDGFVAAKAYAELALGKRENNGVIFASNDTLIPRPETAEVRINDNIKSISEFAENSGCLVTVAAVPRTIDVFSELLPKSYPAKETYDVWQKLDSAAKEYNVKVTELYEALCDSNNYYRTDHHYTSSGAYLVYKLLGESLGYSPFPEGDFTVETVTESFCGTSMRSSGFYMSKKDSIELYRYDGDMDYSVIADGKKIQLYDMNKLGTADKYAVFLGGNHARVDITIPEKNREKLLLVRDSFADSLAPFLARHFDLILIDLRYFNDSVLRLAETEGIEKALVLESITELSTARNLSYLRMK